ncbi:hypothetical protein GGR54DRAFT_15113 [Hypoxylon sp. NC1633]|nr:hypothetical protein GGR54DRAFT_15113 [Hypoxylon sp. NC1633]
MLRSGLLRFYLLIALGTIGIRADEDVRGENIGAPSRRAADLPRDGEPLLWNNFEHVVVEKRNAVERLIVERIPDSTKRSPREQAAPALRTPQPTPPPPPQRKRQDNGQIQALSAQLQSLSQSATRAISSVSSSASSAISLVSQSAQSVRQSADQAVQSANQNADNANRQLSQTQSSASSAVSAASARASDDLSRSLSSMSSRISSNAASAQSSASSAISAARAEASSSAANAVNIAASQIQEARADASGVRGDANSIVTQVQSNSVSGANVAIIVTVSVVGSAILTAIASYLIVRYRRKRRRGREGLAATTPDTNEKQYEKPIAVRGAPESPSPRFTPFGGGTGYPMDKFKLPDLTLSPFLRKKTNEASPSEISFVRSTFSPKAGGGVSNSNDVYGVSPSSFRLQKDSSIKSATSVRLIRVGSSNNKVKAKATEEDQRALLSPILSPAPSLPTQTPAPIPIPTPQPQPQFVFPRPPSLSPAGPPITEPPPATLRPFPTLTTPPPDPEPSAPPSFSNTTTTTTRQRSGTQTSHQRLRFRDSSDISSAEPSPAGWPTTTTTSSFASAARRGTAMRNTNTASLRADTYSNSTSSPPRVSGGGGGRPKNAGPTSFATFPRVRDGPPRGSAAEAILSRGRLGLGLGGVAARLREVDGDGAGGGAGESREVRDGDGAQAEGSRRADWPFGTS